MIQRLSIRNYAIIEALDMEFSEKLTIITGETGAGKSILLGALGLVMGNRADTHVLHHASEKCVVEAFFDLSQDDFSAFFAENDLDYEQEVVIRREISPSGKSRAFVNDTPVNLKVLQDLTGALVDLHQQFDTLDIHQVSFQLRMIDVLADNRSLLESYASGYRLYQSEKRRLEEMTARNEHTARETDFLRFQLDEFHKAGLVAGEQERIEEELQTLSNAEGIKKVLSAASHHLNESDRSVVAQLRDTGNALSGVAKYHAGIQNLHDRLFNLLYELEDIGSECERIAEDTEYEPGRIAAIQERLDVLYRLLKKHQASDVDSLLQLQDDLQRQLDSLADLSAEIIALQASLQEQESRLQTLAVELHRRRQAVIPAFEQQVHGLLVLLAMEHARLSVEVRPAGRLTPTGSDEVEFLFAANRGSRLMPIKSIASGGELARLTLCIKSLVASAIPLPTLIFDEIDSGVSGEVALKMGQILRRLSDQHQVVVITHSPQVAAHADAHYFVYKSVADDRTAAAVRLLNREERVRAIATMLSTNPPTPAAMENARELMRVPDRNSI